MEKLNGKLGILVLVLLAALVASFLFYSVDRESTDRAQPQSEEMRDPADSGAPDPAAEAVEKEEQETEVNE